MKASDYIEESTRYLMSTYRRYPIVMRKGRGVKVWDTDGNEYLDFIGGIGPKSFLRSSWPVAASEPSVRP